MKYIVTGLSLILSSLLSFSQPTSNYPNTGPQTMSVGYLGNVAQEMNFDRGRIYLDDQTYLINGMEVMGSPFLYRRWYDGVVNTADGRSVTGYKLKYNAFNQTVFFSNGKDSLEATDDIAEFSLAVTADSGKVEKFRFVNASQYKKEKSVFYYEVMIDNKGGQLLKANRKKIAEGHNGLPVFQGKKTFALDVEYYYYDKLNKKISRIKGNGINISEILKLTRDDEKELRLNATDLNDEKQLISFFNDYFELKKS